MSKCNARLSLCGDADRAWLGGLTPREFLSRHWQKQPLMIKAAWPRVRGLITKAKLIELACREDAASRVVMRAGKRWRVKHGPFQRTFFRSLPARGWSLLVQDINHFVPAARALIDRFGFIGFARLDDLMVSYAPAGAGVGPHVDSYDVFLLQGSGTRRWQVSRQADRRLRDDVPLKLLRTFRPEQEWILEPGDMLYLPPGWAHNGVALEPCMTYSIGFRAPTWKDLAIDFLRYLEDRVDLNGMYADPHLRATRKPGRLAPAMLNDVERTMERLRWRKGDVRRFLGQNLTEPKAHVAFERPARPLPKSQFATRARRSGLRLDIKTQMLYAGALFFINGESAQMSGRARESLQRLADERRLRAVDSSQRGLITLIYEWYRAGYVRLEATIGVEEHE
jgi:50S ribosomal protein L16 3-hydroxylase